MTSSPDAGSAYTGLEIALVGMAGRFPGAKSVDALWSNLCAGTESIRFFSDRELAEAGVDPAVWSHPDYVNASAVLDDIEWFDAPFFGLSPREAELMDPQQRFLFECVWEALENAGYVPEQCAGRIGLFAGARTSTYMLANLQTHPELWSKHFFQIMLGNDKDFLTTRIAYKLNFDGPSINVHTACSTSLVAVHLACQSLWSGACDMALAGGVSIAVPHRVGYLYQEGGIQSPDGHCRPFDQDARGTVGGNGAAVVVLKRLEDALADRDHIYAVIRGTAINNDGARKVGFTAPGVEGQAQVIRSALLMGEIEPDSIGYIEAHGTGTQLGDPVELSALNQVFREHTEREAFCALGSVKGNIGHLDAAAGVTGVIKAALALRYGLIPPTLHFQAPNPQSNLAGSPFYVNTRLAEWPASERVRRAGVSSFGIGGTNAHAILEDAPPQPARAAVPSEQLLVLSARSGPALDALTASLAEHLRQHPALDLADVAYTLQNGRRAFGHRRALVCRSTEDAAEALETLDAQRVQSGSPAAERRPLVFLFPGQGAQYAGMARGLYEHEPVFRATVDQCAELLAPHLGLDIRPLIFDEPEQESTKDTKDTNGSGHDNSKLNTQNSKLTETVLAQPALFVVEYALARLWMSWGVEPQAMIGHSIGEYAAACLSGVFSLEDALGLVAQRGRLMQSLPGGAMLSVPLAPHDLQPLLGPSLSLAAVNGPSHCVVAGEHAAADALQLLLAGRGVRCRKLHTSHAFHSPMMEPILAAFAERVRQVDLNPPRIPFVSNVTGDWITSSEAMDPQYWVRHLRQTVQLAKGFQTLGQETHRVLLEVGPGQTLSTLAKQQPSWNPDATALASLPHPRSLRPDRTTVLETLGQLWLGGCAISWQQLAGETSRRLPLPTYPFERQPYWIAPAKPPAPATPGVRPLAPQQIPAPHQMEVAPLPTLRGRATAVSTLSAAAPDNNDVVAVEQVIEQQLHVMLQQLQVLDKAGEMD
ncbi:MAG TPA: type I polyketide synthase [Roseiflexaceae bacterium]|nr:type I polyketide synthase [Roseiflexaceae bacterium]